MLAAWILVGIRVRSLAKVGVGVGCASAGGMAGSLVHDCDGVGWGRSQDYIFNPVTPIDNGSMVPFPAPTTLSVKQPTTTTGAP